MKRECVSCEVGREYLHNTQVNALHQRVDVPRSLSLRACKRCLPRSHLPAAFRCCCYQRVHTDCLSLLRSIRATRKPPPTCSSADCYCNWDMAKISSLWLYSHFQSPNLSVRKGFGNDKLFGLVSCKEMQKQACRRVIAATHGTPFLGRRINTALTQLRVSRSAAERTK